MIILSITLYLVAALLLAHGIIKGIKRGIIGQSLRLGVNLISAVVAFLVGSGLMKAISKAFAGLDLAATIASFGLSPDEKVANAISSIEPSTVSSIASVPVAILIVPVLTIIVYIIVKILLLIPLKILAKIIPDGLLETFGGQLKLPLNKILGATIGVIGAILTLAILVFPFAVISGVGSEVSSVLAEGGEGEASELISTYADPVKNNGAVAVCDFLFGGVYRSATSVKTAHGKASLELIARDGATIYLELASLDGRDIKSLSDEEIASITGALSVATGNDFFCPIVLDVLSVVTENINAESLGIDGAGFFGEFADSIISIFATTDKETLVYDVETLLKIVSRIGAAGVIDGDFTAEKLLEKDAMGRSAIGDIVDILASNSRYSAISASLSNAALQMVLDNSGVALEGIDAEKASADIKSALVSVSALKKDDFSSDSEYEAAVAEEVKDALRTNGIDVDGKIDEADMERFDSAIVEIIEEMDISEDVSDEEMLEIMISYYEKYMAESGS